MHFEWKEMVMSSMKLLKYGKAPKMVMSTMKSLKYGKALQIYCPACGTQQEKIKREGWSLGNIFR